MIWKLLVGVTYMCFGIYLIAYPILSVATLTLLISHRSRKAASFVMMAA